MTGMVPDSLERRGKIKSSKTNLSISTDIKPSHLKNYFKYNLSREARPPEGIFYSVTWFFQHYWRSAFQSATEIVLKKS